MSFLGQSMAYAMDSCQLQKPSHLTSKMNMMADMDYSMDSSEISCCQTEHLCAMSGCVSMAITSINMFSQVDFISQKINQSNVILFSQPPSSLYRPPLNS